MSTYKSAFTPIHLVFLELDIHHYHLDFKIFDENNTAIISKKFFLQLLNKDNEYLWQWCKQKIHSSLNTTPLRES